MAKWSQIYRVFINPFAEDPDDPDLIGGRRPPKKEKKDGGGSVVGAEPNSWGRMLGYVLAVVLALLWESAFRDANRLLNLYYDPCILQASGACSIASYASTKIFFLFLVVLPLFVFYLLFRRLLREVDPHPANEVLLRAFGISVIWMSVRFILDLVQFLLAHHRTIGVYAILIGLAALLIAFIFAVTRNDARLMNERKE